jgi:UrcA family protein
MKKTLGIILTSFLATAAVIKAAPAFAEHSPAQNMSIVHTGDLNLSTEAGRRHLDERLVIAAREVCGSASDVDLAGKNQVRQCRADVLAKARTDAEEIASRDGRRTILVAASR